MKRRTSFSFFFFGTLFFFISYFAVWPILWHLIFLSSSRPDKHQLRVESHSPKRTIGTSLFLDKPNSSLSTYALWQIPQEGFYHIKLTCVGNGKVSIDRRSIISLVGVNPDHVGEGKEWMAAGPHFLELQLNTVLTQGWLKIEVAGPHQAGYAPLSTTELSFLENGNIATWLKIISWVRAISLIGLIGFSLLTLRFLLRKMARTTFVNGGGRFPERSSPPSSKLLLLGSCLFLLILHFAIWPLVWHGVILPKTSPEKHQLRVESPFTHREAGTALFLDKPDSFLSSYAVWQVSQGGLYQLRLSCDDNGQVLVDNRPVLILKGLSSRNIGETKLWLTPGPHLLEMHLNNEIGQGWLSLEVARPGPAPYQSLSLSELNYIDLGNLQTWLAIVFWGEYLCLLGCFGLGLLWLVLMYLYRWRGKLFPSPAWRNFFMALGIFALGLGLIFHTEHPLPPIWGDGFGIYAYLPTYFIYHDPSMENLYSPTRLYDYPANGLDIDEGEDIRRYPATGRYIGEKPIGSAVLMFPFFLLGHLLAPLTGSAMDGFSIVYQFSILAAGVFYLLAGLFLLFKILIRYFSSKIVTLTLLSLFFGTNLLAYSAIGSSMSHIYSFFLICCLIYLTPLWYDKPSWGNTLSLGLVAGLIPLIRNPNLILLAFLPLYGISDWAGLRGRISFLWQNKNKVLLLGIVAFLVFSPQMIIWKIATGHFLVKTYMNDYEGFSFLSPQIVKVLFHPHHGLLIWSPILFFSLWGLWKMKGQFKPYRLPIIVCLLLHLYLVSCWYVWWYSWSFGHRAFVDVLGFFALPLACFFGSPRRAVFRKAVIAVSFFFVILTFHCFMQYFQGVLPGEIKPPMNWPLYQKIVLNPDGWSSLWNWLGNPTMNDYRLSR